MGALTAELCEQQKNKIEFLENRIKELESGALVEEARKRNHELNDENQRLQARVDDLTCTVSFYQRIITYFLNKEGE